MTVATANEYAVNPEGGEHEVKLPSGFTFLLRYPSMEFRMRRRLVAQSVGARIQLGPPPGTGQPPEELAAIFREVLCETCMQPRVSMTPQAGELHPDRVRPDDATFIVRWAGGEVDDNGVDLAAFRGGKSGAIGDGGAGGEAVRPVAEQPVDDAAVGAAV